MLYDDYIEHAKKQGVARRAIETQIGMFLTKVVGPNLHRSKKTYRIPAYQYEDSEKRGPVYEFPPLSECRQMFANLLNEKIDWDEDGRLELTGAVRPRSDVGNQVGQREVPVPQGFVRPVRPFRPFSMNSAPGKILQAAAGGTSLTAREILFLFLS